MQEPDAQWVFEHVRDYIEKQLEKLQFEVDRRVETQLREAEAFRDYVSAVFTEKDRAVKMADMEREKAAAALRTALEHSIGEGYSRLHEHIEMQVVQIRTALVSADQLELARINSVQRELAQAMVAANEAVRKAEIATEKRFESVNEWRAQSADRERSQGEERAKLQATYMLKEVADARFEDLQKSIGVLERKDAATSGITHGRALSQDTVRWALGFAVAVLTIIAWVAVATHGFQ